MTRGTARRVTYSGVNEPSVFDVGLVLDLGLVSIELPFLVLVSHVTETDCAFIVAAEC